MGATPLPPTGIVATGNQPVAASSSAGRMSVPGGHEDRIPGTPAEAAKEGWPTPAQSDQAPDLLLYAADGYAFKEGDTGDYVTPTREIGAHGYPNSDPLMQGIFIAAGFGIQPKGEIPAFPNLDIAPTIAQLLHISLGKIQGKPLTDILESPGRVSE